MLFNKEYDRKQAEPVNLINRYNIKVLLIQSKHDGIINYDCAVIMKDVLEKNGNDCELYEVIDKHNTHSFYTVGCFVIKNDQTLNKLLGYIRDI